MRKVDELERGCMARAGDQEMTFVLLSRDACAPAAIRYWVSERIASGKNKVDDPQIIEAIACAEIMEREGSAYKIPLTDGISTLTMC